MDSELWNALIEWANADEWRSFSITCTSRIAPMSGASRPRVYTCTLHSGTIAIDDERGSSESVEEAVRTAFSRATTERFMGRTTAEWAQEQKDLEG